MSEILNGEVVEALVAHEKPAQVNLGSWGIRNPKDLVGKATEMADALAIIITNQQLFKVIQGKKYVLCEGWTTLGAMMGVVPIEEYCRPMADGRGFEAKIKLIRASDGGQVGGASAECTRDEKSWESRDSYALRSMSITRATGKAFRLSFSWIMKLAGFEPTPAEEMPNGSVEAAQEVAKQKLAVHAKARSSEGAEILTITPYMQGFAALSGTGLSIVRANMDDSMRAKFGWVQKGNVFMIPVEKVTAMVEFCTFHSVSVLNEVPEQKPKTNGHAPATPPVSVDDFKKKFSSVPFADDASTDPLILSVKTTTSKTGKPTMWIKWNGHEISTFDKDLFPYLEDSLNKTAMLSFKENSKYKNLLSISRLDGKEFRGTYQATDDDLPY